MPMGKDDDYGAGVGGGSGVGGGRRGVTGSVIVVVIAGFRINSPDGSINLAVTKIIRLRLKWSSALDWKSRPMMGMSPRMGTLSSTSCTSSRMRPPMATVWPSQTVTAVVTLRV